ncbi:guanylate kinase [Kingella denitrificans]|uniref:Guanylate kinase n=1 Tax=Kingella denitrificans ATCC 33394 TaxID=888741 RepID=F0EX77_9NEIS|nr:guanylate kinase [Kingella denitrificans]EGC18306.1 guanylate kinase [Kingella denitrificans ATCC 33394]QQB41220.1 guanylate kinase [Kingella denitrificans]RKW28432.1 MAG: guanylate kinase [Kingella sp. (in: b-proteobacteria)]STR12987.1 Guanylate kinase [Kingella denitrificans]
MSKGNIFVISAASGTGKTTLVSRLVQQHPNVRVSVSHTTRPPRAGEVNGQHYHFVSEEEFVRLAGEGAFLEHAQVFGNYYGTSYESVQSMCEQGYDVILEIDVQGAQQVRKALPEALSIFILPPSLAVLEQRLRQRQTDSEEVIARRLSEAVDEIQQALTFDYVVSNRSLQQAEEELWCIFQAARLLKRNHVASIEKVLQNT